MIAYLIEQKDTATGVVYYGKIPGGIGWTRTPAMALRFCRREDGEWMLNHFHLAPVAHVLEHDFEDGRRAATGWEMDQGDGSPDNG